MKTVGIVSVKNFGSYLLLLTWKLKREATKTTTFARFLVNVGNVCLEL